MQLSSERFLPAPPHQVWAALNDPAVLQQCIPGCRELKAVSGDEMHVKVQIKVGPISATFGGKVTLQNRQPPQGYRMQFSGDGAGGFARGTAQVRLAPHEGGTLLSYETDISIGGKLAQVGSRLVDAFAKSNIEDFFTAFAKTFPAPARTEPAAPLEAAATPGPSPWRWAAAWPCLIALAGASMYLAWRFVARP